MKKLAIWIVFALLLTASADAATPSFNYCKSLYEGRNFSASRDCSLEIIKSKPSDVQARYLYATSLNYTQEYDKALEQYRLIVRRYPNTSAANMAANQIEMVNNRKSNAASAPKKDYGNYVSSLESTAKWGTMPVRVWVQPSPYAQTTYNAFAEWQYATNGTVKFVKTAYESQAKIKVYFVDQLPSDGIDKVGLCKFYTMGKYLQDANIYLLYKSKNGVKLSNQQLYPVALHEIGHAIGLNGHSTVNNDVMYPNTDIVGIHTSRRDVNTVKAIYAK